jgi:hypothetical protein
MRKQLSKEAGERKKFRATFSRIGKKMGFKGYAEETILLTNVIDMDSGIVVTDHIWFSYSKTFQQVSLAEGVIIEFDARIRPYKKGYINKRAGINRSKTDFKLNNPTKVKVVG